MNSWMAGLRAGIEGLALDRRASNEWIDGWVCGQGLVGEPESLFDEPDWRAQVAIGSLDWEEDE